MSTSPAGRRRSRRRLASVTALGLAIALAAVEAILDEARGLDAPAASEETPVADLGPTIYVIGDFGYPVPELAAVGRAIRAHAATRATAGMLIELGDNVYPSGLPADSAAAATQLGALVGLLDARAPAALGGEPLALLAIPGNHDHDAGMTQTWETAADAHGAIENEMLPAFDRPEWHYAPAHLDPPGDAECPLATRLDRDGIRAIRTAAVPGTAGIAAWACLTRPARAQPAPAGLALIAIDSQVLIGLEHHGERGAADLHWRTLETLLAKARSESLVPIVLGHHPLESYGRHRPLQPGRVAFGPGWPDFTQTSDYLLAIPGVAQLTVLGWYGSAWLHEQDVHAPGYAAYRRRLTEILTRHEVALYVAGHDHSLSLTDIGRSRDLGAIVGQEGRLFQLVSGATANLDPLSGGPALLYRRSKRGHARLALGRDAADGTRRLQIEIEPLDEAPFRRTIAAR
ncbi:MAG: metallophosphoesterase [bacterium]